MDKVFTKEDLIKDLKNIGIQKGDLLHLKVSLKAIGKIEGGPKTLIEALLDVVGKEGTIISDAFVPVFPLPLSKEDSEKISEEKTPSYAGAFANAMIKHSKSFRSKHPIQKFSAIGAMAKELCHNHTEKSGGYELLWEMVKLNAKNLTIGKNVVGVGTTHVAIEHMGFKRRQIPVGRNYKSVDGKIKLAKVDWNGGCGVGFLKFIPLYREKGGMINEANIGNAHSYFTDMKKAYDTEMEKLKEEAKFFFCNKPDCYSCRMTWEHSDKKYIKFYFNWLKSHFKVLNFKKIKQLSKIAVNK
ncbi:MAG: AAC(3) family N-acetyltransferase [Bacteroidota bacterium]|nr:AAC(3) family N-acetyltransferase [Bacteroidota bacterium]